MNPTLLQRSQELWFQELYRLPPSSEPWQLDFTDDDLAYVSLSTHAAMWVSGLLHESVHQEDAGNYYERNRAEGGNPVPLDAFLRRNESMQSNFGDAIGTRFCLRGWSFAACSGGALLVEHG